jgi:hypothetical protein
MGLMAFSVDASNGTAVFHGDMMMAESDGNVAPASAGSLLLLGAAEGKAAASGTALALNKRLLAASTAGTILAHYDPEQKYLVQYGNATPTQTDLFNNADHVAGAGSAVTGLSGHTLGTSLGTGTAGFKLLDFLLADDNDEGSAYVRIKVEVNEHMQKVVDATASASVGPVGV